MKNGFRIFQKCLIKPFEIRQLTRCKQSDWRQSTVSEYLYKQYDRATKILNILLEEPGWRS